MGGSKAQDPPRLIIPRVSRVGLLPPLLSLVTGALSGWLLVPLSALSSCSHHTKKGKNMFFHPIFVYPKNSEFSEEFNNGQKGAFFESTQNNYPIPDQWFIIDAQYCSWRNIALALALAMSWILFLGLAYTCRQARGMDLFFPRFISMAIHATNLQRQGFVANLVYKNCSPENY